MQPDLSPPGAAVGAAGSGPDRGLPADAAAGVTALYQAHALALIRLAYLMLGDRASAEDVVQEAFCGLYRQWPRLADAGRALPYLRACVLNGSRSQLRRRARRHPEPAAQPPLISAEAAVITSEERREVLRALRQLPARQREAVVLRFYLDLSPEEAAATMGIGPSSVRSATHRALTALGRLLQESP